MPEQMCPSMRRVYNFGDAHFALHDDDLRGANDVVQTEQHFLRALDLQAPPKIYRSVRPVLQPENALQGKFAMCTLLYGRQPGRAERAIVSPAETSCPASGT